jgi:predicted nucleic acid-binding protein
LVVVDTNVIAALYLPNQNTEYAEKLLMQDSGWAAPILWRSELRNVLMLYIRKQLISFELAYQIQGKAEALLNGQEYQLNSLDILRLAESGTCSAYDCEFVALSRYLNVKLITQDKKILAQFPQYAIALNQI